MQRSPGAQAMEAARRQVQNNIGHPFNDPELLVRALTHPSYAIEQHPPVPDNQRLEFLGDAVLQLVTTERLFQRFPQLSEGPLTDMRSVIVKEEALVGYAEMLGLGPALRLGVGEERSGGRKRPSNLADAFESVLGAVYLDGGLDAARAVCRQLGIGAVTDVDVVLATENPKGALQETTQQFHGELPCYETIRVSGPEHMPRFDVRVCLGDVELARASAGSRRSAEKAAAEKALARLRETLDSE